jgi:hypothetical protein
MIAASLFLSLAAQAAPTELLPRTVALPELASVFPDAWRLPEELWRAPNGANDAKLLPVAFAKLVARDFRAELGSGERELAWCGNFGDCVVEWRKRGANREGLDAMLGELASARPKLAIELVPALTQLLRDATLRHPKWTPGSNLDDDGMYFGEPIELRALDREPWKSHGGARRMQQAAALVFADLDALKAAENDFPAVAEDRGTRYEFIAPVIDTYLVGEDAEHGPFAAHRVHFRWDLPFPFSNFDCELAVLTELDRAKHVVTYIYSQSRDALWLAGEDFLYPVRDSRGEWCATLIVRIYGFDLRGVPDGDGERAASLRGSLGNLKFRAEQRFADYGGPPRTVDGALPKFRVLGVPRK